MSRPSRRPGSRDSSSRRSSWSWRGAGPWRARAWEDGAAAGAGIAVLAFLASLAIGSHWLASDVSLLFFFLVAVVASPRRDTSRAPAEPAFWKPAAVVAVLVFALAAAISTVATARPSETFRWSSRIGFHQEESGSGGRFRWTRRRFAVWLQPGESRSLSLSHFSPGREPVDLSASVDGRQTYRRSLNAGESVVLALNGSADRPRPVVFEVSRAFIPKRLGLSQDRRELGLLSTEQP
jgi:hypothetical protein